MSSPHVVIPITLEDLLTRDPLEIARLFLECATPDVRGRLERAGVTLEGIAENLEVWKDESWRRGCADLIP